MTGTEITAPLGARYDPSVSEPPTEPMDAPAWPVWKRLGLRIVFTWFIVQTFPGPLNAIPGAQSLLAPINNAQSEFAVWFARNILGITAPMPIQPTGSGDTMVAWVSLVPFTLLALVIAAIWCWADVKRKRNNDARVAQWMIVYVRLTLAFILFNYGFAKIWQSQFPFLAPDRLTQPLGEMSPMGLLWTFMAYSKPYNVFAGLGEAGGALLLCFNRTATLGALVAAAVMANVVALNFMYDVPVKQFSALLLIMALIVAAPDARRLANVLLFHRATDARVDPPLFASRRARWGAGFITAFLVFMAMWQPAQFARSNETLMRSLPETTPFYGVWDVEEMQRNGKSVPLLATNPLEWRRLVVSSYRTPFARVRLMRDSVLRFTMWHDSTLKKLRLTNTAGDTVWFRYTQPKPDRLVLAGRFKGDSMLVSLQKSDKVYLLTSRGFNWVQELPFNR